MHFVCQWFVIIILRLRSVLVWPSLRLAGSQNSVFLNDFSCKKKRPCRTFIHCGFFEFTRCHLSNTWPFHLINVNIFLMIIIVLMSYRSVQSFSVEINKFSSVWTTNYRLNRTERNQTSSIELPEVSKKAYWSVLSQTNNKISFEVHPFDYSLRFREGRGPQSVQIYFSWFFILEKENLKCNEN